MSKAIIISPEIEDIKRLFADLSQMMLQAGISCSLIAYYTNEQQVLISAGNQSALCGSLVAQLRNSMTRCNQETQDIVKGIILKEIFNQ